MANLNDAEVELLRELAERWWNEADANADEHPAAAHATEVCSRELHALLDELL